MLLPASDEPIAYLKVSSCLSLEKWLRNTLKTILQNCTCLAYSWFARHWNAGFLANRTAVIRYNVAHGSACGPVIVTVFKTVGRHLRDVVGVFDSHTLPPSLLHDRA